MRFKLLEKGEVFSTRQLARAVFKDVVIMDGKQHVIDFKGIRRVAPSFLHEMLIIFSEFQIETRIENMNDSVAFQLKKAERAMLPKE